MEVSIETKSILKKFLAKNGDIPVIMKLKGHILDDRFKIKESLSEGAFGKVYSGYDTIQRVEGVKKPIIIKFSQHHTMHEKEYNAISEIKNQAKNSVDKF